MHAQDGGGGGPGDGQMLAHSAGAPTEPTATPSPVEGAHIRRLEVGDIPPAAVLHRHVLDAEFLSTCGGPFLRRYYKAWIDSPSCVALCAVDSRGQIVGVLLGSLDPVRHYRSMLRSGGVGIAARLVAYALVHPKFAGTLLRTRALRYGRGLLRAGRGALGARRSAKALAAHTSSAPENAHSSHEGGPAAAQRDAHGAAGTTGELAHLLVDPGMQGRGVGRRLVDEMVATARRGRVGMLVLVTPPDAPARRFYNSLGWAEDGEVTSGSGERFVRFRLEL